ncbi:hypothetical protein E0G79_21715 [Salmonella enterica]|nr:hypothetical protein [Salmonella enterica]EEB5698889.1 hypothetical protein [Salmonella enterica]EHQ9355135.1 hypothetical protein [Salmonella enterica]EHR1671155.1 hypothetical protein [Salmonella enterica]EHR8097452.1 hypothetical protein [Salmonella enterica]
MPDKKGGLGTSVTGLGIAVIDQNDNPANRLAGRSISTCQPDLNSAMLGRSAEQNDEGVPECVHII